MSTVRGKAPIRLSHCNGVEHSSFGLTVTIKGIGFNNGGPIFGRDRTLYRETFKRGAVCLKPEYLPTLKHLAESGKPFVATGVEVLAAGVLERDGKQLQYQDVRIFVEDPG